MRKIKKPKANAERTRPAWRDEEQKWGRSRTRFLGAVRLRRDSASGGRWLVASRGVRGPPAPPPSLPRFSPPRLPPCIVYRVPCSVSGKPNHGERMGRLLRGIRLHGSPRGGTGATARTGGRRHAARQLQCDRASQSLRGALKPGAPRCPRGTTGGAGTAVSMAVGSSPLPSCGAAAVGGRAGCGTGT